MASLENNSIENVHVMHKSLTVLLFKGLVAWILVAAIYLIGGIFISGSNTLPIGATSTHEVLYNFWPSITVSLIVLFLYGGLIFYITLDWITSYYILSKKAVVTREGIILTKEGSYDMSGIESIEVTQGLFGRLFNFGTLELFNPILDRKLKLFFIPDPHTQAHFIQRMHPNPERLHFLKSK